MMGPAIFELYSSNYNEGKRKNEKNDGNGNPTSIIKNKKSLLKDNKLNGIYNLLSFDNSQKFKQDKKSVSNFTTREVLTDINEEEKIKIEPTLLDRKETESKKKRNSSEFFKSSSDGFKIKNLINPLSTSNSMQTLNCEKNSNSQNVNNKTIARFPVIYVGQKILDKKYTLPMLPWIISEFRREVLPVPHGNNSPNFGSNLSFTSNSSSGSNFGLITGPTKKERKKIWLEITDRCVLGIERYQTDVNHLNKSFIVDSENENLIKKNTLFESFLFSHKHEWICKIQRQENEEGDLYSFAYLVRDFGSSVGQNNENKPYTVHVFECEKNKNMVDLIASIKSVNINLQKSEELGMDSSDSLKIDYSENSNNLESILGNSQQYEVMYLGKINLNEKQISSSFIDEGVLELSSNENDDCKNKKLKSKFSLSTDTCLKDNLEKINKSSIKDNLSEKIENLNEACSNTKTNISVTKSSEQDYFKDNQLCLPENNCLNTNTQSLDDTTRNSILNDLQEVNRFNQKTAEAFVQRRNRYSNQSLTDQTIQENMNSFNELNDIRRSSSAKSPSKNNNHIFNSKNAQLKFSNSKIKSTSSDVYRFSKQISLPVYGRPRTNSGGSHDILQRYNSILQLRAQNRTMLFLIGRYDICLLCLDNQQVLLNKSFNTIIHFDKGSKNSNCFGFICREQNNSFNSYSLNKKPDSSIDKLDATTNNIEAIKNTNKPDNLNEKSLIDQENFTYVGYVFKGENEKLVNELMFSLKQAFRNAHHAIQQSKLKDNVFCLDCPLYFYHNLCIELLEVTVEKAQCIILTKIGELSSTEYKEIMSNYEGVQVNSIREQNEILMSLIKRFYEKKQLKHSECRTKKNQQNLRTTSFTDNLKQRAKKSLSTSFETILKLRHTDSNTENLRENLAKLSEELKIQNQEKENFNDKCTTRSTINLVNNEIKDQNLNLYDQPRPRSSTISSSKDLHREMTNDTENIELINKVNVDKNQFNSIKPTSSKLDAINSMRVKSESLPPKSPLLNIFIKSSNQNKSNNISDENLTSLSKTNSNETDNLSKEHNLNFLRRNSLKNDFISEKQINESTFNFSNNNDEFLDVLYDENGVPYEVDEENTVSWRKAIFSSIHCNTRQLVLNSYNGEKLMKNVTFDNDDLFINGKRKRTREELRELWRKAIYQQITLIKMEKENLLIQENQHEVEDKRLKLDYDDIMNCNNIELWNQILTRCDEFAMKTCNNEIIGNFDCFGNTQNFNLTKYGSFLNSAVTPVEFAEAVQNGCPKNRRGEIWCLLADIRQRNGVRPTCSPSEATVDFDTNYRVLLQQLTSQQHAILVDLGRTFPKHPYYAQPLGSGQLGLFNLLKAYSLFDKEVGYCQGLSFVAGILLLHMPEDDAFEMMKHLLFFLGLRKQYKPDMSALQMQFYQLTRLLYDHHRDIYEHFEKYEISPVLYAAPWFLTLFASQFSIGFVARLFDFIFLFGIEAIFRISLSLFAIHKQALLLCNSFENIIHYLKNDLVETENYQLESMFSIAFALDITRQLIVYEIEYQVIQEEIQYKPLTITYDCFNKDFKTETDKFKNFKSKQLKLNNTNTKNLKVRKVSCSAIQQPQTLYHHLKQRKISSTVAVGSDCTEKIDFSNDSQTNEKIKELEKENKNLKNRNMEILDQLHVAQSSVYSLESSLDSYKSTIKRLETRVRALEDERDALLHMVAK